MELTDLASSRALLEAIPVLIDRLKSSWVERDDDLKDSVCSALVNLGAMVSLGNLQWRFTPDAADTYVATDDLVGRARLKQFL